MKSLQYTFDNGKKKWYYDYESYRYAVVSRMKGA